QTPLAWEGNKRNIIGCIEEAKSQDISILCLPELCITGYGCEDMFYASGTCETALEILQDIVEVTSGIIVSVGLPIRIN
ncbi:nitrilase-related carbon-nitrogen hydrolase, partial [Escherichia coli]